MSEPKSCVPTMGLGPAAVIYVLSVDLNPDKCSPSGSLNFSRLDSVALDLSTVRGLPDHGQPIIAGSEAVDTSPAKKSRADASVD